VSTQRVDIPPKDAAKYDDLVKGTVSKKCGEVVREGGTRRGKVKELPMSLD